MTGIMFQDITTLLLDPKAFKDTIDLFVERYKGKNISVVAGKQKEKNAVVLLLLGKNNKNGSTLKKLIWFNFWCVG